MNVVSMTFSASMSPPSVFDAGQVRLDSPTLPYDFLSRVWASVRDINGDDVRDKWLALVEGDVVTLRNRDDSSRAVLVTVAAGGVEDFPAYVLVHCTLQSY